MPSAKHTAELAAEPRNLSAAREAHDVVHGEKIRLVLQLFDQSQLVFDLCADLVRHAVRPAPAHALFGELTQPAAGAVARRHQLGGIAVTQLVQAELATFSDRHAFAQQRGGIDRRQRLAPAQMVLTVAEDQRAGFGQRHAMADRGQRVLQGEASTHMHVHVAGSNQAQLQLLRQRFEFAQALGIVGTMMQFHRQPRPLAEGGAHPAAVRGIGHPPGQPQRERARHAAGQIGAAQPIGALGRGTAAARDQLAQRGVAVLRLAQQHQLRAVVELKFRAHDQLHAGGARSLQRTHDASQRAFVSDRQRAVTTRLRPLEQLTRTGCAASERKRRQTMQLGVGTHANHPCSIQPPCSPAAQNAHPR